jgi:hypothetical protein
MEGVGTVRGKGRGGEEDEKEERKKKRDKTDLGRQRKVEQERANQIKMLTEWKKEK